MPTYVHNRKDHTLAHDKANLSPVTPAVTGIDYPCGEDATTETGTNGHRGYMAQQFYTLPNIAASSIDDVAEPPTDSNTLDLIWGTIRLEKERKMAKERPKVQSLEEISRELAATPGPPPIQIPVMESHHSAPKSLKKQKSISTFRESTDGRSIVATFELPPELEKQDVHISFQRNRLIVTWEIIEISEWEEDGCFNRERVERIFHRTLPLPEGTRFEEIHAQMTGRGLTLRYPNMRSYRVEARSRSAES